MSIIIRDMAMPRTCIECKLRHKTMCLPLCQSFALRSHKADAGRLQNCPLVPLPEGHGDLIDKTEAYDRIAEQEGGNYIDMDSVGIGLEECQTIVPAEGCGNG